MKAVPWRFFTAVPILIALAWAAVTAVRFGESESAVYVAGKEMGAWTASAARPGQETVGWVRAALGRAAARDPPDPSIKEMLARLALLGSPQPEALEGAITHLTESLQHRPTSPYSWASLAEAFYRRGDTGPRFEASLQRAASLGPWEPEVQLVVVDYGLAVWNEVGTATQAAIQEMVANGMARQSSEILQISERRGRLTLACAHLGASKRIHPKWARICKSTEAT